MSRTDALLMMCCLVVALSCPAFCAANYQSSGMGAEKVAREAAKQQQSNNQILPPTPPPRRPPTSSPSSLASRPPVLRPNSSSRTSTEAHRSVAHQRVVPSKTSTIARRPIPKQQQVNPSKTAVQDVHHGEPMSAQTAVANVIAVLSPHGMLPIAFGMAAAGGTGPAMATIVLFLFGVLSWYSLLSFARAAEYVLVQKKEEDAGESLSAVWERTLPNGRLTKFIPDLGCVCLTVGCLLFYSTFIGDLFGSMISGSESLPSMFRRRSTVLLLLHAMPILPLCLKKDLSSLKYSSMTGLFGILYTIFFVGERLLDKTYAEGGEFFDLMPKRYQPSPQIGFSYQSNKMLGFINDIPPWYAGKGLLVLMNMCSVAYACHYNAVKYYMELKQRTLPTFQGVMAAGIGGTALVFWCMMILGYATFGRNAQALLLNNYHNSKDILAHVARLFTGISIILAYAMMFDGLKAALFSLTKLDQPGVKNRDAKQKAFSVVMLTAIAIGACFVTEHELGTVIGIVGSLFGSVVIYIFPSIININLLRMKDSRDKPIRPFFPGEQIFNYLMGIFGLVFAVLGTKISLEGDEA